MIGCLILYHSSITNKTKLQIFQAMFAVKEMQVEEDDEHTVIGYIFDVSQLMVWQAALEFECADVLVGFGFGTTVEEVKAKAYRSLAKRISKMFEMNALH
ncbi:hypothetical protein NC797_12250 [Aquibacillus sp. 3ASR75-11]|uniref:Uncharacterized protein n=1 Tax=Terrihalobacillus insolitus TaxID=2950438 RepID=A0A9X4AP80_9BACI|nr:hypothetical protein [Terrihalobacillus insolitus]MDC3425273.1 hypothetical protein [Terrihalobacillus insolitus]